MGIGWKSKIIQLREKGPFSQDDEEIKNLFIGIHE
jgi:hypothetical protein